MHQFFFMLAGVIFLGGCVPTKIQTHCGKKCEPVTLFYMADCKEIKGYVNFDKTGLQRVFQHELPEMFRKDSISVCIKYETIGAGILMSDCLQSEIIKVTCIQGR